MSVVGVCSGKGSPGATFTAVNLAGALARAGDGVLLVDLDLAGGDIAAYLGLDARRGLWPIVHLVGPRPSADALKIEIQRSYGMDVIGGLARPLGAKVLDQTAVVVEARGLAPWVICDLGRIPGPGLSVLPLCDHVLAIVGADVVTALGAERALAAIGETSVSEARVRLVVSGHRRRRLADLAEIGQVLSLPVAALLPYAPIAASRALENQRPVAGGAIGRAFDRLAEDLRGLAVGAPLLMQSPEEAIASA
jgi:Flp pilus assembly CpaE family ATPase